MEVGETSVLCKYHPAAVLPVHHMASVAISKGATAKAGRSSTPPSKKMSSSLATRAEETLKAVKIGAIASGSITLPNDRPCARVGGHPAHRRRLGGHHREAGSVDVRWDCLDEEGCSAQQDGYRYVLRLAEGAGPRICVGHRARR